MIHTCGRVVNQSMIPYEHMSERVFISTKKQVETLFQLVRVVTSHADLTQGCIPSPFRDG